MTLSVDHVTKTFHGKPAVDGVSLEVKHGHTMRTR